MITINGFGDKFIGKKHLQPDGYYTTTKWLVILFLPIIYKGTYYIKPVPPKPRKNRHSIDISFRFLTTKIEKDERLVSKIRTIYWSAFGIVLLLNVYFYSIDSSGYIVLKILIYWFIAALLIEWQKDIIK
jgi:hypothetical protein